MKQFLYLLCQWTWGLPQNLVGLALYLYYRMKGCPNFRYQGAFGIIWTQRSGSMSMGSFLFMHPTWTPADKELLAHEYGHTIQSLFFGPLYLLTVGVPSILWAASPASKSSAGRVGATTPSTRRSKPPGSASATRRRPFPACRGGHWPPFVPRFGNAP